ncbi:MAG: phosphoribosyltransferase [Candidatus Coatesbacteria bacterium]|nr:phosphoribosyltransferase [Candidatus Coatesbacteria bacterium]
MLSELIAAQVQTSHFDYLCGIPHSGHPLTVSLAQELDKPAVCLSKDLSGTRSRQARALLNGKRLLLIDSSVNTGLSAALSAGTVQQLGAQPIGVACLFYNDTFPSPVPYLNDLLKQGKLWYLLKYSDLI